MGTVGRVTGGEVVDTFNGVADVSGGISVGDVKDIAVDDVFDKNGDVSLIDFGLKRVNNSYALSISMMKG